MGVIRYCWRGLDVEAFRGYLEVAFVVVRSSFNCTSYHPRTNSNLRVISVLRISDIRRYEGARF